MHEIYNLSQWHWIADRVAEGHTLKECGDFLGMKGCHVAENLEKIGRRVAPEDRIDLMTRKEEFNALANDGSPKCSNYLKAVRGTDKAGNVVEFKSLTEASKFIGVGPEWISHAIRYNHRCRGFKWEKVNE